MGRCYWLPSTHTIKLLIQVLYYLNLVIFVSQSIQFPTYENADQVCYFQSLDSCSLTDLTASSTIYVAVYFYEQTNFTVVTELVQSQPIKLGLSYEVNFTSTSAGLVTFTIDEQYD